MEERRNTNNNLNETIHSFIQRKEGRRLAAVVVGLLERSLLTEMCKLFIHERRNERNDEMAKWRKWSRCESANLKIKTREIRCTVTKNGFGPKICVLEVKATSKIKNQKLATQN